MKKIIFSTFLLTTLILNLQGQKQQIPPPTGYTFHTHLNLDAWKDSYGSDLTLAPFPFFDKSFNLRVCIVKNIHIAKDLEEKPERFVTANSVYNAADPNIPVIVDVTFTIPFEDFKEGPVQIGTLIYNKAGEKMGWTQTVFIEEPDERFPMSLHYVRTGYLNYRLKKAFTVSSPEQVGLTVTIDYLKYMIDSSKATDFKRTVEQLDIFKGNISNRYFIDELQLKRFYKLLDFIEPYIRESSFLNSEARKLRNQTFLLKNSQLQDNKSKDTLNIFYVMNNLESMDSLYSEYVNFYNRIKNYYEKLELILFLKVIDAGYNDQLPYNDKRKSRVFVAGGPTIGSLVNPVYDVTISSPDTVVHFENKSKLTASLTAGLLFRPFTPRDFYRDTIFSPFRRIRHNTSDFVIGIFLNYYLTPKSSILNLGASLGIGYKVNDFSFLLSVGFKPERAPRSYFVDGFKGQNKKLPPFSGGLNDNSRFINKFLPTLGFSFVYCIPFTKRAPPKNTEAEIIRTR